MMVFNTIRLTGSLLLWAGYQGLLVPSSTKYASAEPNSITLDNENKITFFQEPESESNPSSMEYYSGLYHPSSLQTVVHHNKTPVSQSSSKLKVSEPSLKLFLALFTVNRTLQEHRKQPDTLEKITELDPELKQKHYNTEHNTHGREFKILDAYKKSQKHDACKTDGDCKGQTSDMRGRYHKGPSKSSKQTNTKAVTKSSKTKDIDYVYKNISNVVDFLYNTVFGSCEKNKKQKVSLLDGNVDENNQTGGKECENLTEDEHFMLNHVTKAGQHNMRYRRSSPLTPIYKVNTNDSIENKTSRDYKKISPLETLYSLVSYVFNQEYEKVEKQTDFIWKDKISQANREDFEVYEKGIKLYSTGHLEDQRLKDGENKETSKDLLLDFDMTGEEESLSTLINNMDHNMNSEDFSSNYSYNVAPFSSASVAENVEINRNIGKSMQSLNHTNSSKFEKNLSTKNNLQPSSLQDSEENDLINEKEHQRSSGWMGYVIIAASVVVVLILISLLVVCGAKLCGWQKNRKQHMLEILQPSAAI